MVLLLILDDGVRSLKVALVLWLDDKGVLIHKHFGIPSRLFKI